MVVGDFDLHSAPVCPDKAHAPLVVDSDTVLALPVSSQGFESVRRRYPKVGECRSRDHSLQSHTRPSLDVGRQSPYRFSGKEAFSVVISKSVH